MNSKDKAIIDNWDGESDEEHMLDVYIKPEFHETVRTSPGVDTDSIVTIEQLIEIYGDDDYDLDGELWLNTDCPSFWLDVEDDSMTEWVAEELGLKVEWILRVETNG